MSRLLLVALPALLCAYVAGRLTAETAAPAPTPTVARTAAATPAGRIGPISCRASLSASDLEALTRELTAAVTSERIGAAPDHDAAPGPEPFVGDPAAAAQAHSLVDSAIAAGRWRDQDALRLGSLMTEMGPDDQREVVSALTVALNQQHLTVTATGPLF